VKCKNTTREEGYKEIKLKNGKVEKLKG